MQFPEVIHTPTFTRSAKGELSETDIEELEWTLTLQPELGNVVGGTGGLRKVRLALGSRGKSAGARVCYFYRKGAEEIYLIYSFRKSEKANLSKADKAAFKKLAALL